MSACKHFSLLGLITLLFLVPLVPLAPLVPLVPLWAPSVSSPLIEVPFEVPVMVPLDVALVPWFPLVVPLLFTCGPLLVVEVLKLQLLLKLHSLSLSLSLMNSPDAG